MSATDVIKAFSSFCFFLHNKSITIYVFLVDASCKNPYLIFPGGARVHDKKTQVEVSTTMVPCFGVHGGRSNSLLDFFAKQFPFFFLLFKFSFYLFFFFKFFFWLFRPFLRNRTCVWCNSRWIDGWSPPPRWQRQSESEQQIISFFNNKKTTNTHFTYGTAAT